MSEPTLLYQNKKNDTIPQSAHHQKDLTLMGSLYQLLSVPRTIHISAMVIILKKLSQIISTVLGSSVLL